MKILFLRGSVPSVNEHPEKLAYSNISDCEDMWTQLFHRISEKTESDGIMLYDHNLNSPLSKRVSNHFTERHVREFKDGIDEEPDVIISRGGFQSYIPIMKKYPKAKKIYYGAGRRAVPDDGIKYDVVLCDCQSQINSVERMGMSGVKFIKPAAELFLQKDVKKEYDVLFVANGSQADLKGHMLMLDAFVGTNVKILNIGNIDKNAVSYAKSNNIKIDWAGWKLRKEIPELMSKCMMSLVCTTDVDSAPRVIPESIACGIPLVCTSNINFWKEDYINDSTGVLCQRNKESIRGTVFDMMDNYSDNMFSGKYNGIRKHYDMNLSIDVAANIIIREII